MMICVLRLAVLALLPVLAFAQATIPSDPALMKSVQASFPEYLEGLTLPNDAVNAPDIQKNAEWYQRAFEKRGFRTQLLPNNGKPLVFAEYPRKTAGAKTILFYMHIDGQ